LAKPARSCSRKPVRCWESFKSSARRPVDCGRKFCEEWTDGFFGLRFAWESVATERRASTDQDQEHALQLISIDDPPSNALLAILGVDLLALLTANPLYL
jgi:hypothetical protein